MYVPLALHHQLSQPATQGRWHVLLTAAGAAAAAAAMTAVEAAAMGDHLIEA
jgi:hypothetical protein